jgi:hypothetical protein
MLQEDAGSRCYCSTHPQFRRLIVCAARAFSLLEIEHMSDSQSKPSAIGI